MKKRIILIISVLLLLTPLAMHAKGALQAEFREGVDLLAAVWRLAGAKEYNRCAVTPYAESLDTFLARHKAHHAVVLARKYYGSGTGYDAVAEFGSMITINDGHITIDTARAGGLDHRWTETMREEFLPALDDFYRQTDFHSWYATTDSFRREAQRAFIPVAEAVDMEWFGRFFGEGNGSFKIILSLLVGPNNYGISSRLPDSTHQLTPVIGCADYDDGHITYDKEAVLPIVIHEFCHAYCNPLVDAFHTLMEPSLSSAYAYGEKTLRAQAYTTPLIMMYETLVRSSVIRYLDSHPSLNTADRDRLIREEEARGFSLTTVTERALSTYESKTVDRTGLKAFMPELAAAVKAFSIKAYAKRKRQEKAAEDKHRVHYRCNIKNGARNIVAGDMTLSITFDSPMKEGISIGLSDKELPEYRGHTWSADHRTISISFHTEPSTTYGMIILGDNFVSTDGRPSVETELTFTTKKAK